MGRLKTLYVWLRAHTHNLLTVVHELGHILACVLLGSKVNWVKFRFIPDGMEFKFLGVNFSHDPKNPGTMNHEMPKHLWQVGVILLAGPILTITCLVIPYLAALHAAIYPNPDQFLVYFVLIAWLAVTSADFIFCDLFSSDIESDGQKFRLVLRSSTVAAYEEAFKKAQSGNPSEN